MSEKFEFDYRNDVALPILGMYFTDSKAIEDIPAHLIHVFAPGDCVHAGLITGDHGQKFGTEEGPSGLVENSLEQYTTDRNRIVALYYWTGWDDPVLREAAETYLAEIRRMRKEDSKYDWRVALCFLPWIGKRIKADPNRQWCSENVLSVHDKFGFKSGWSNANRGPSPAELEVLVQKRDDVRCCLGYYIGGGHA